MIFEIGMDHYFTIENPSEGLYREKGSRFLGFAQPVNNENEIRAELGRLKKKYHDARHHCYAWVLDTEGKVYRAYDDGEPGHSAGDPILGQIRSKRLTNVLVVVVRYFGGTKLGVSGLIHAYKTAAELSLSNAVIVRKEITACFDIHYPYELTNEVMRLVHDLEMKIVEQHFQEKCTTRVEIGINKIGKLEEKGQLMVDMGKKIELVKHAEGQLP